MGTTVYEGSENPPIVLIPSIYGLGDIEYTPLIQKIKEDHPNRTILVLNSPLLDNAIENQQFNTVKKQASFYLNEVEKLKQEGLLDNDLVILGYSYGGKVAYELSKQAIKNEFNVNYLGIIDTDITEGSNTNFDTLFLVVKKLTSSLALNNETLKKSVDELINKGKKEINEKNENRNDPFKNCIEAIFHLIENENKQLNLEKGKLQEENQKSITSAKINLLANVNYILTGKLDLDKVTVFQSNEHKTLGWGKHFNNKEKISNLEGNHFDVLTDINLIKLIFENIPFSIKKLSSKYSHEIKKEVRRDVALYLIYAYYLANLKKDNIMKQLFETTLESTQLNCIKEGVEDLKKKAEGKTEIENQLETILNKLKNSINNNYKIVDIKIPPSVIKIIFHTNINNEEKQSSNNSPVNMMN